MYKDQGNVYAKHPDALVYFTQRNNDLAPSVSCFPTSVVMALANNGLEHFVHPEHGKIGPVLRGLLSDDAWYAYCNTPGVGEKVAKNYGLNPKAASLNIYWDVEMGVARWYLNGGQHKGADGFSRCAYYSTSARMAQIEAEIDAGRIVVLGTDLARLVGGSGHIVTVAGYNSKDLILMDPYGNPNAKNYGGSGRLVKRRKDDPLLVRGRDANLYPTYWAMFLNPNANAS